MSSPGRSTNTRPGAALRCASCLTGSASTANGRWSDFGIRLLSTAILGPVVLLACLVRRHCLGNSGRARLAGAWAGMGAADGRRSLPHGAVAARLGFSGAVAMVAGYPAALAVMALLTMLIALRFGWFMAIGLPYAGIGGLALLWLRLQPIAACTTLYFCSSSSGAPISAPIGGPRDRRRQARAANLAGQNLERLDRRWLLAGFAARWWRWPAGAGRLALARGPACSASLPRPAICWKARSSANWGLRIPANDPRPWRLVRPARWVSGGRLPWRLIVGAQAYREAVPLWRHKKLLSVLGSTGSVGTQTLDIIAENQNDYQSAP